MKEKEDKKPQRTYTNISQPSHWQEMSCAYPKIAVCFRFRNSFASSWWNYYNMTFSLTHSGSYPGHFDPRSVVYPMCHHTPTPGASIGHGWWVQNHPGICTGSTAFGEIARIYHKDTFNNLWVDPRAWSVIWLALIHKSRHLEWHSKHTFAKGGNALGTIKTSGRPPTISPSFK